MMKRLLIVCLILSFGPLPLAAEPSRKIETSAERVTLFIDGAQVVRSRQVDLPAGTSVLLFTGLSPYMDAKSIRVTGGGECTIIGVEHRLGFADSAARSGRLRESEAQLERIRKRRLELNASREVVEAETELLKVNCSTGNRTAVVPLANVEALTDYYAAQLRDLKKERIAIDEQRQLLDSEERQLRKELARQSAASESRSEIEVQVEVPASCRATFTLTYYVRNAGWFPIYDVRSAGLAEPLAVSYRAQVFQNTEEEWRDVALTLSSSNPATGTDAPQLRTYWLDYGLPAPRYDEWPEGNAVSGVVFDAGTRDPVPGATVVVPGTTVGTATDADGRYSISLPDGASELKFSYVGMIPQTRIVSGNTLNVALQPNRAQLDEVVVTAYGASPAAKLAGMVRGVASQNDATIVTDVVFEEEADGAMIEVAERCGQMGYEYEIRRPYTVPSGGKTVSVEIGRYELPAVYAYRCTPKIDRDAFLVAEATGSERYNLLEGEANVYFEGTFVGKGVLSPTGTTDTLRFSMGRDRGIVVRRDRETDYNARKAVGSNRTQTTGWLLTVRNTRREAVSLTLCDQLPVSRNSDIVVTAEELSGGRLDAARGIVVWNLELRPGEQRELRLRYKVKYPKERHLTVE